MARVKKIRTRVAIVVAVAVLALFGSLQDVDDQLTDHWLALLLTPWLLIVTGPVVLAVLIRCAPADRRRAMRSALRTPLRQLAWFISTLLLVPALVVAVSVADPSQLGGTVGAGLSIACVAAELWAVFLFLFASGAVVQTGFGTAAVHPAAPALLTCILVWELAAVGGLPAGPPVIAYMLLIGGPSTVTAITWWEIHRLRSRYTVTLRSGPNPLRPETAPAMSWRAAVSQPRQ
ncbi:hypothetical protein [Streptomyces sp. NRRL S-813]|uniref:hypothetical protein n=1 Tax=Streptomyces sp. NRRL S-813 TaxID=1463919 RepID=UPI000AB06203|nr:hypothetical protein [Streptomyces sp. NRRL S-813]